MHGASLDSSDDLDRAALRVDDVEPIVAGVAHDFGNILAVITNYASLASRRIDDPATEELLDKVRVAANRAARLNRQLHDLAECGRLRAEPVDVNELLRDLQPLLRESARDGCSLRLEVTDEPLIAMASRGGIEMALRHVVDNAGDALPEGGTITIGTRLVDEPGHAQVIEIRTSDRGVGMPAEVLERALEPRFSTQPKGQTSGLGLTIVDRVVRTIGGEVLIESTEGSGTTVRLRLAGATIDG